MTALEIVVLARRLAWFPTGNLGGRTMIVYRDRYEAHRDLVEGLASIRRLDLPADLRAAIRRVAECSFANRRGEPYYRRKASVLELRGCLDAFDREAAA